MFPFADGIPVIRVLTVEPTVNGVAALIFSRAIRSEPRLNSGASLSGRSFQDIRRSSRGGRTKAHLFDGRVFHQKVRHPKVRPGRILNGLTFVSEIHEVREPDLLEIADAFDGMRFLFRFR